MFVQQLHVGKMTEDLAKIWEKKGKTEAVCRIMKKSFDDIADFCLQSKEFKEIVDIGVLKANGKHPIEANKARHEGNLAFKSMKYADSLMHYTEGIIKAKFKREDNDAKLDNVIALCYAGRAATLFEEELYEECLKDIARAIEHDYPLLLKSKLLEIKTECLLFLGKGADANKVLEECTADMEKLNTEISVEKKKDIIDNLQSKVTNKENFKYTYPNPLFYISPPVDTPKVEVPHKRIPSLSSAVSLSYSVDKGRHLVANRDITPGEVIISEKMFAFTLGLFTEMTNCSNCLLKTVFPIPCPTCDLVVYCSEECRTSALEGFHGFECPILPTIRELKLGSESKLCLKILLKVGLKTLRRCIPQYNEERRRGNPAKFGFNPQLIYSSSDYRTIYNQVTNKQHMAPRTSISHCVRAYLLLKLLENTPFFKNESPVKKVKRPGRGIKSNENSPHSDRKLVFSVILTHIMAFSCHLHEVIESSFNSKEREIRNHIAFGVSSVHSLLNHSCDANTYQYHFQSCVHVTRAIQLIQKGFVVTRNYGLEYDKESLDKRKIYLENIFHFKCDCPPCVNKWPMIVANQGSDDIKIVCRLKHHGLRGCPPRCQMLLVTEELHKLRSACLREQEHKSIFKYDIEKFKGFINLLCLYSSKPCIALYKAKNILKKYYGIIGFRYHSNF